MKNNQRAFIKQAMTDPNNNGFFGENLYAPGPLNQGSSPSSNSLQSFVEKMGGIEGILSTVEKTQKFIQTVSPLLPLLGSLFKKKKKNRSTRKYTYQRKRSAVKKSNRALSKKNR
ncbi:hypothetical protein SD70_19565 [Gordoniibacillus kamchatkensis]|uniref:Uncharacterized protein n=1 Tax=Gordoniibacillus kamchatkensis TaxID=1590651 RepID=A0ABR5AF20_9BACL|nr:hypothetical protein [Paenibacillus sp. VKM B-2647]KIL39487.1 hypothetical protein SD70_19565 [Paenibacillus sp. VKM B-2647]